MLWPTYYGGFQENSDHHEGGSLAIGDWECRCLSNAGSTVTSKRVLKLGGLHSV